MLSAEVPRPGSLPGWRGPLLSVWQPPASSVAHLSTGLPQPQPVPCTVICLVQDVEDVSQFQGQLVWLLGHVRVDALDLRAVCQGTGRE